MSGSKLRILGVMTGTSCDGLDAACIEVDRNGWRPLWESRSPYHPKLRERVLELQNPHTLLNLRAFLQLHFDLGDWYATSLKKIVAKQKLKPDIIANHGQTLSHFPSRSKKHRGMTFQAGEETRIAALTGLTVISHFREGDLSAGGQGAPLVPRFHQALGEHLTEGKLGVAIHNLGGISNLTYLHPNGKIIAFDTGPGNLWIDAATQKASHGRLFFDRDGRLASEGAVDASALKKIMRHPFFRQSPPKSTGREDFPIDFFFSHTQAKGNSLVATATQITAETIALAYEKWILKKGWPLTHIFFCGGGANNLTLLKKIQDRIPSCEILSTGDLGLDPQFIEAQAFAFLGFLSLMGIPLGGPWTGAHQFGPPGQITPGENWDRVISKLNSLRR